MPCPPGLCGFGDSSLLFSLCNWVWFSVPDFSDAKGQVISVFEPSIWSLTLKPCAGSLLFWLRRARGGSLADAGSWLCSWDGAGFGGAISTLLSRCREVTSSTRPWSWLSLDFLSELRASYWSSDLWWLSMVLMPRMFLVPSLSTRSSCFYDMVPESALPWDPWSTACIWLSSIVFLSILLDANRLYSTELNSYSNCSRIWSWTPYLKCDSS